MTTIVGIAGSLRAHSFNAALLGVAAGLMPEGATLEIASIKGVPLYDADVETSLGIPDAVLALKARIVQADGLLLATPEYNNSIPGVFKNAIDWLSRPATDIPRIFGNRPVAIMGASPGGFGTILAQNAWLPVLRALKTRPWFGGRMIVSRAGKLFSESGELNDEQTRAGLRDFLHGFVAFVEELHAEAR
ncbi:MAG: NAD(P)H-dependent oxidoreductase [Rudaea sp.]|nr:NAD(P)H-dependent oxidoreductase [Rudaea sp.]